MKNQRKKMVFLIMLGLLLLLVPAVCVNAKTKRSGWYTGKTNNVYYYEDGKRATGLVKIGKHKYYFDEKGIQRTGWQKVGKNYYFFRIKSGKKGYSVSKRTINGIYLRKNGKASQSSSIKKRKLALLYKANMLMQSITNNKMTKVQKLRAAFNQTKKLKVYNRGTGFQYSANWDIFYTELAFNTGRADCYGYGTYFAYLANAVGYKAYCVSSGGHGWSEINGKVYDANWDIFDKRNDYFGMDYSLSGKNGRPRYATNRLYVKEI